MSSGTDWLEGIIGGPVAASLSAARLANASLAGRGGLALTSPAFPHGGELDPSFTAIEDDAVAPPLAWTAPPPGTQELVLIVEDADEGQVHWLVWGLKPQKGALFEGEVPPRTGKNARGNSEWLLPAPPLGVEHRYVFQLFALDLPLALMPGATRDDLVRMMDGHVIGVAVLVARFEGHETEELDAEAFDDDDM